MVLKRRIDHGFSGFQVANIPRGPRSIRKKGPHKKSIEDGHICAFELLASLAGKLLQESEISSVSSNASEENDQHALVKDAIKQERQDDDKAIKAECGDHGSCEVSAFSEAASQNDQKCFLKEFPHVESDAVLERTSTIGNFDCPEKFSDVKSENFHKKNASGHSPNKAEGGCREFGDSGDGDLEHEFEQHQQEAARSATGRLVTGGVTRQCSSKDPLELSLKISAPINSSGNTKLPSSRVPIPNASFSRHRNDIKLGSRDDSEKFLRCNKLSTKFKAFRSTRIGDRRIRKLLTSKYWKVAPTLKDYEFSKADGGMRPLYRKRKACYNHERFQVDSLYKRRKFSDRNSVATSDGAFSSESVSNSPQKGLSGANGVSCSVVGHQASFHHKDSNVKFSIKSFKVPELFIEVPETATVGSLKRTVMEAVTAILGGGIRVGVLLQGKKVRDDNRTLSQTGISCEDNLNTLGFTLEPSVVQPPPPSPGCSEDPLLSLHCEAPQEERSPVPPVLDSGIPDALPDPSSLTDTSKSVDSSHELIPLHSGISIDQNVPDSRALVPVPAMKVEALAVVPMNQKPRRSELAQRRTRRPFSVAEVEALVQAVEELGTGRWRDVKLRAFENADHRTYVDLKDKWKTLVHTAKIAPQQRRGEPVPQELLDRVLAAHAYWSQHQAKQQGKHQSVPLKITNGPADVEGTLLK